jgi:hypothetical protein
VASNNARQARGETIMENEMRKMTVHVMLDAEGQKDAIRRGLPAAEKQTITGEVDIAYLDKPYTSVDPGGTVMVGNDSGRVGNTGAYYQMCCHPETAQAAAEWWERTQQQEATKRRSEAEKAAAEQRKRENEMRAQIQSQGPSAGIVLNAWGNVYTIKKDVPKDLLPAVRAEYQRKQEVERRQTEQRERERREREEGNASEKQARDDYVLDYVREHGTDLQKERLEAGMLPLGEAYDACREWVFKTYDLAFHRYQRMTVDEVRDYDHQRIEFETETCETATDEQWQQIKLIKAIDGKADVTLRRHIATDEDEDEVVAERFGILVERQSGPVRFSREFACDSEE